MKDIDKAKYVLENMPQVEVAKATKIAQAGLSIYKNGGRDIRRARWETVHKLALYYDKINSK